MLNHASVTVGDIGTAVDFYQAAFGLRVVMAPLLADQVTHVRKEVFGPTWRAMRMAHLVGDDGVGVELFEPVDPTPTEPRERFEYWQFGVSHLGFTVSDMEEVCSAIEANGGRRRTAIYSMSQEAQICYCEDPWGTQLELVSVAYAELVAGLVARQSSASTGSAS